MRYVYKLRKVCIKSNGHSVTSVLIIFLPQLTTNLELTLKLCGKELRLPIAIAIWIRIKMALPCKHNSRSGSRSGSTYPDRNHKHFVPCKRSNCVSSLTSQYKMYQVLIQYLQDRYAVFSLIIKSKHTHNWFGG